MISLIGWEVRLNEPKPVARLNLTLFHLRALEILITGPEVEIETRCPPELSSAMQDLWQYGYAERLNGPLRFRVTPMGKQMAHELHASKGHLWFNLGSQS